MTIHSPRPPQPETLFWMTGPMRTGTLVFLPDLGGNVLYARNLVPALADRLGCAGLRLDSALTTIVDQVTVPELGRRFAQDLLAVDLPRPLYLAGFSFAGLVAFETACHLDKLGAAPDHLWLLDSQVQRKLGGFYALQNPLVEAGYAMRYLARNWRRLIGLRAEPAILHRYGLVRMDLTRHPEGQRKIIAGLYGALADYRPTPWPKGKATLVRASKEAPRGSASADLGWHRLIPNCRAIEAEGDHLSLLRDPARAAQVAAAILANPINDIRSYA